MQQVRMMRVTNPSDQPFSYPYDGEEYTVPAGRTVKGKLEPGSVVVPEPAARHLANHARQCDRRLALGLEPVQATYAPAAAAAPQFVDPETGQAYATAAELAQAIQERVAAQFRQGAK